MALDIKATFAKHDDVFCKFEHRPELPSKRPDLCAFLLLDRLAPGAGDLVCSTEHDTFFLDVDLELLANNASEADLEFLSRCGVLYDASMDCLYMFT